MPPNAVALLGAQEIPLHPQIIEHFKNRGAVPGMKWLYHSKFLTLEDISGLRHVHAISPRRTRRVWLAAPAVDRAGNIEEAEICC